MRPLPSANSPSPSLSLPQMPEQSDLLWNDTYAPELILDFDATHIGKWQAVKHFGIMVSCLGTFLGGWRWRGIVVQSIYHWIILYRRGGGTESVAVVTIPPPPLCHYPPLHSY